MSRWIEYKKGELINGVEFVSDHTNPPRRKAVFICPYCKEQFIAAISDVKTAHTKSCGCLSRNRVNQRIHNMSKTSLYRRYSCMKRRCYNKANESYHNYGGRGIKVCDEWMNDVMVYANYLMSLPHALESGYTIDRINNDGDYEPGNVRWVKRSVQLANRRRLNSKSGYTGVFWSDANNGWCSRITVDWNVINMGQSKTKEEALYKRNKYIINNGLDELGYRPQEWRG